jgi:hypothetical protein
MSMKVLLNNHISLPWIRMGIIKVMLTIPTKVTLKKLISRKESIGYFSYIKSQFFIFSGDITVKRSNDG